MDIKQDNIERIQTRIDMIRQESRTLSYRIERMTEQTMEIQIEWSTEDVLQRAKDNDVKLTEDEANSILLEMQRDYDADVGINWETIDDYIDDLVDERDYSY